MTPIIYYRKGLMDKEELRAAEKYFKCVNLITDIPVGSLVIGRYSLFPFYLDQQREIENIGSKLVSSYSEYEYIADLQNYVYDLQELTFKTWNDVSKIPEGKYVLKGGTNSRKNSWKTSMFADSKKRAIEIYGDLLRDSLIGQQNIYIREYESLFKYFDGVNGMPVTKEFRFFVCNKKVICGGYYWSNYIDDLPEVPDINEVPHELLDEVISRVGDSANAYVIDVGLLESGKWKVVELNDLQFSGLSCIEPEVFYKSLYDVF